MAETMKALAKTEAEVGLSLIEVPIPTVGPTDVLIRVTASSICGTDVHVYNWDAWSQSRIHPTVVLGHEFAGEVVDVGREVKSATVGDFVSAEGHIVDHNCGACRAGMPHLCANVRVIGIDRDGAFAEYVAVPASNVWHNPPELTPEIASLQDPFGNAVYTATAFDLAGKRVLITGVGPIGLMTIPVAKVMGAQQIIVTDVNEKKLELAAQLGADARINPLKEDVVSAVRDLTGDGADVLLEMSGAPAAINSGLAALRPGAEAAVLGVAGKPFEIDWSGAIVFKGVTIKAIYGRRIWDTWHRMKGLLSTGAVDLSGLITHKMALADFEQGFALMQSRDEVVGKVVLYPN
ncbi:MAG: L-threonine 3-dehydrogenase [Anaerolineales bacterium]|nr:L-threonine 3-dehydrogenase [Anaerolineales bacterium]